MKARTEKLIKGWIDNAILKASKNKKDPQDNLSTALETSIGSFSHEELLNIISYVEKLLAESESENIEESLTLDITKEVASEEFKKQKPLLELINGYAKREFTINLTRNQYNDLHPDVVEKLYDNLIKLNDFEQQLTNLKQLALDKLKSLIEIFPDIKDILPKLDWPEPSRTDELNKKLTQLQNKINNANQVKAYDQYKLAQALLEDYFLISHINDHSQVIAGQFYCILGESSGVGYLTKTKFLGKFDDVIGTLQSVSRLNDIKDYSVYRNFYKLRTQAILKEPSREMFTKDLQEQAINLGVLEKTKSNIGFRSSMIFDHGRPALFIDNFENYKKENKRTSSGISVEEQVEDSKLIADKKVDIKNMLDNLVIEYNNRIEEIKRNLKNKPLKKEKKKELETTLKNTKILLEKTKNKAKMINRKISHIYDNPTFTVTNPKDNLQYFTQKHHALIIKQDRVKGEIIKNTFKPEIIKEDESLNKILIHAINLQKLLNNPIFFKENGTSYTHPISSHNYAIKNIQVGDGFVKITFNKPLGELNYLRTKLSEMKIVMLNTSNTITLPEKDLDKIDDIMFYPEFREFNNDTEYLKNTDYLDDMDLEHLKNAYKGPYDETIEIIKKMKENDIPDVFFQISTMQTTLSRINGLIETAKTNNKSLSFISHVKRKLQYDIQKKLQAMTDEVKLKNAMKNAFNKAIELNCIDDFTDVAMKYFQSEFRESKVFYHYLDTLSTASAQSEEIREKMREHMQVYSREMLKVLNENFLKSDIERIIRELQLPEGYNIRVPEYLRKLYNQYNKLNPSELANFIYDKLNQILPPDISDSEIGAFINQIHHQAPGSIKEVLLLAAIEFRHRKEEKNIEKTEIVIDGELIDKIDKIKTFDPPMYQLLLRTFNRCGLNLTEKSIDEPDYQSSLQIDTDKVVLFEDLQPFLQILLVNEISKNETLQNKNITPEEYNTTIDKILNKINREIDMIKDRKIDEDTQSKLKQFVEDENKFLIALNPVMLELKDLQNMLMAIHKYFPFPMIKNEEIFQEKIKSLDLLIDQFESGRKNFYFLSDIRTVLTDINEIKDLYLVSVIKDILGESLSRLATNFVGLSSNFQADPRYNISGPFKPLAKHKVILTEGYNLKLKDSINKFLIDPKNDSQILLKDLKWDINEINQIISKRIDLIKSKLINGERIDEVTAQITTLLRELDILTDHSNEILKTINDPQLDEMVKEAEKLSKTYNTQLINLQAWNWVLQERKAPQEQDKNIDTLLQQIPKNEAEFGEFFRKIERAMLATITDAAEKDGNLMNFIAKEINDSANPSRLIERYYARNPIVLNPNIHVDEMTITKLYQWWHRNYRDYSKSFESNLHITNFNILYQLLRTDILKKHPSHKQKYYKLNQNQMSKINKTLNDSMIHRGDTPYDFARVENGDGASFVSIRTASNKLKRPLQQENLGHEIFKVGSAQIEKMTPRDQRSLICDQALKLFAKNNPTILDHVKQSGGQQMISSNHEFLWAILDKNQFDGLGEFFQLEIDFKTIFFKNDADTTDSPHKFHIKISVKKIVLTEEGEQLISNSQFSNPCLISANEDKRNSRENRYLDNILEFDLMGKFSHKKDINGDVILEADENGQLQPQPQVTLTDAIVVNHNEDLVITQEFTNEAKPISDPDIFIRLSNVLLLLTCKINRCQDDDTREQLKRFHDMILNDEQTYRYLIYSTPEPLEKVDYYQDLKQKYENLGNANFPNIENNYPHLIQEVKNLLFASNEVYEELCPQYIDNFAKINFIKKEQEPKIEDIQKLRHNIQKEDIDGNMTQVKEILEASINWLKKKPHAKKTEIGKAMEQLQNTCIAVLYSAGNNLNLNSLDERLAKIITDIESHPADTFMTGIQKMRDIIKRKRDKENVGEQEPALITLLDLQQCAKERTDHLLSGFWAIKRAPWATLLYNEMNGVDYLNLIEPNKKITEYLHF